MGAITATPWLALRNGHEPAYEPKFVLNRISLWLVKSWFVPNPNKTFTNQINSPQVHGARAQKWTSWVHFYIMLLPWCNRNEFRKHLRPLCHATSERHHKLLQSTSASPWTSLTSNWQVREGLTPRTTNLHELPFFQIKPIPISNVIRTCEGLCIVSITKR